MPYTRPTVADLKAKYRDFAEVPDSTVQTYIDDADGADESWIEADFSKAIMAKAAHDMALMGLGDVPDSVAYQQQGVTSIKSGQFSAQFDQTAAKQHAEGSLKSTPYGREYFRLLRRNKGGPRIVRPATTTVDPLA